jgi:uncharacterized protein
MTAERHIDYEALAQGAMRGIVRTVLGRVAKEGLPGEHHFYIAFNTEAPGVVISKRLKQKYPEEMTVVLQHRFWDLTVTEERFEVKLTFDGIPERLSVPFAAVKVFFDPSVPYGLQFEESEAQAEASDGAAAGKADGARTEEPAKTPVQPALRATEKKPRAVRKPRLEKPADDQGEAPEPKAPIKAPAANTGTAAAASEPKVVSLDKFRKK